MKNLFIILIVLILSGCGSRKKNIDRNETSTELNIESDSSGASQERAVIKSVIHNLMAQTTKDECLEFEVTDGNSLSIEKFDKDGQLLSKTVVTGSGKATQSTKHKKTETVKTEDKTESKASSAAGTVKKKVALKASASDFHSDVVRTGFSFMDYIWWIIVIIIILVLCYLEYQFKWIGFIKKHVLKLFSAANTLAKNKDNEI